jgi:hypothetical protein
MCDLPLKPGDRQIMMLENGGFSIRYTPGFSGRSHIILLVYGLNE